MRTQSPPREAAARASVKAPGSKTKENQAKANKDASSVNKKMASVMSGKVAKEDKENIQVQKNAVPDASKKVVQDEKENVQILTDGSVKQDVIKERQVNADQDLGEKLKAAPD